MNKDEFIKSCAMSGYCSKHTARIWCDKHQKDEYTPDDFVEAYRYAEEHKMGERSVLFRDMGNGNRNTISGVNRGLAGNNRIDQDC